MNKCEISIWGRTFELSVCYKCYQDEGVQNSQKMAFEKFYENKNIINESEFKILEYVLNDDYKEEGLKKIDNIFKYVMPKSIYVPRSDEKRVVVLLCDYKFDMEHGMAIVFENEHLREIGNQDIVF